MTGTLYFLPGQTQEPSGNNFLDYSRTVACLRTDAINPAFFGTLIILHGMYLGILLSEQAGKDTVK